MIPCQRHLFDLPEDVAYLNCAYMSPLMYSVVQAGRAGLERKMHPWEIRSVDFFSQADELRALGAQLFNSRADDVALMPSASYGLAIAAANVPVAPGQRILVLEEQFPSNYYAWERLAIRQNAQILTVGRPQDGDWTAAVLAQLASDVAVAALPQTHWISGGLLDLEAIGAECRRLGIALVLDLTQSLGAYPFDAARVQPDFAVAAGYKWLMGPYSWGLLYVAPKWQNGRPIEENWAQRANASDFSELTEYTDQYAAGARRFDVGEKSRFALIPAAMAAIQQILAWGVPQIAQTVGAMTARLAREAGALGFEALPWSTRAPHYLSLKRIDLDPHRLMERLAAEQVYVSVRGASVRVTPHVYNSDQDLDRFIGVLKRV
jgi:selenocysteine lyase/cysteine desulfurase